MPTLRLALCLASAAAVVGCADRSTWHEQTVAAPNDLPRGDEFELWDYTLVDLPRPLSREVALKVLLETRVFAPGSVTDDGYTPNQLRAFHRILAQPDAAPAFRTLLRHGRLAGRLYALCGLYHVDKPVFDRSVEPYRRETKLVAMFEGCILEERPASEIVECKNPDTIRLAPGQTIKDWLAENKRQHTVDIFGGAHPSAMVEYYAIDEQGN